MIPPQPSRLFLRGSIPWWALCLSGLWTCALPIALLRDMREPTQEWLASIALGVLSFSSVGPAVLWDRYRGAAQIGTRGSEVRLLGGGSPSAVRIERDFGDRINMSASGATFSLARGGLVRRSEVTSSLLVGVLSAALCTFLWFRTEHRTGLLGAVFYILAIPGGVLSFLQCVTTWVLWAVSSTLVEMVRHRRGVWRASKGHGARIVMDETLPLERAIGPRALWSNVWIWFLAIPFWPGVLIGLRILFEVAVGNRRDAWLFEDILYQLLLLLLPWRLVLVPLASALRWRLSLRVAGGRGHLLVDGVWRPLTGHHGLGPRIRFEADDIVVWAAPPGIGIGQFYDAAGLCGQLDGVLSGDVGRVARTSANEGGDSQ